MKKNICAVALICLSLCLFSCETVPPYEGNGVIFGFVSDFSDGEPVRDANVQLRPGGQTQKTGSDGRFQFSDVKPGHYDGITVSKFGYTDLVDPYSITIGADQTFQRDVTIKRQPVPLRLVASDGTTGDITGLNFGSAQDVRSFSIYNENPYAVEWEIQNNTEWIIVNQSSGTLSPNGGQQPIAVTIDRVKQPEGVFGATISVTSDAGTRDLAVSTRVVSLLLSANPAAGGAVSPKTQSNIVPGLQVGISADANPGYTFVNWTVTNGQAQIANPSNRVTTAVLSTDASISANFQNDVTGGETPGGETLAAKLRALLLNAVDGGDYTIELTGNANIGAQDISFPNADDVTVRLVSKETERVVQLVDNGRLFRIGSGVTFVVGNNVTLKGHSSNNTPLIYVNGRGTLIMESGSKIMGNTNSQYIYDGSAGGIYVDMDGIFTMKGGEISGMKGSSSYMAGGVFIGDGGRFSMEGGKITKNNGYYSGGIRIDNGLFIMTGGEISGNTSSQNGGGVGVVGNGKFEMYDGVISGNTAGENYYGGGVYVSNAAFTMKGGENFGNTAAYGGGVFVESNASMSKTGGTIYGYVVGDKKRNTATKGITSNDKGHAVFVNSSPSKRRETIAGEDLDLDSKTAGATGGWE